MLEHRLARLESVDSDLEHGKKLTTKMKEPDCFGKTVSMVNSEEMNIFMTLQVAEYVILNSSQINDDFTARTQKLYCSIHVCICICI